MSTFDSLIDKLPAMLTKIRGKEEMVASDSPEMKAISQEILVNSPSIRQLSAVKSTHAVKTPGGFDLTGHTKPRRVPLETLIWVPIQWFKKSVLGNRKVYVCGRLVQSQAEVTSASNIKFPVPANMIPVEVFCLPTKDFCQYYTVKTDTVYPYNAVFPGNATGDAQCWSESYRDNILKVLKHVGYKTEGDAEFICAQAAVVADEYLRLALLASTPIPEPSAVGDNDAGVDVRPTSLFGAASKDASKGTKGAAKGANTVGTKEGPGQVSASGVTIRKGVYLVYNSKAYGRRTSNQVSKVIEVGGKLRLQMKNDDVIESTESVFACETDPTKRPPKGELVPLSQHRLRRLAEYSSFETDPALVKKRKTSPVAAGRKAAAKTAKK